MWLIKNRSRLSLLKQFKGTNYWYNIVSERRQVPMSTYSIIPITRNSRTGKTDTNYNDGKQIRGCLRWRWSALPGKGPQGTFRGDKNVSWEKWWLRTVYTFVRTCQIEDIKYIHFIINFLENILQNPDDLPLCRKRPGLRVLVPQCSPPRLPTSSQIHLPSI